MYDFEASDTDYSYEYSDVEYNTLDPYDYELNNFKNETKVEETPEDQLLSAIESGDLDSVIKIYPQLLISQEDLKVCNGDAIVTENGDDSVDEASINSEDDICKDDEDEDELFKQPIYAKKKEIVLKTGETPLMSAASSARVDIVRYILSLGVDVNHKLTNSNNCAVLSLASNISVGWRFMNNSWRIDAPKVLQMLIDAGANVKVKGYITTQESGYTALHYAAQSNYWELFELLIHAGADVDAMNNQKETALMLAASRGFVACCNILLLAGANADLTDKSGSNASYLAGVEGHKILSDAISVYSGSAQHNIELYKIWSQFVQKESGSGCVNNSSLDVADSISNTCIGSFCLAIDSPYLIPIMQNQGVTISDLKVMSVSKLREIGVSEDDCDKIMTAMQDFNKHISNKNSNISFEYGRPLKPVAMLEMLGNMSEHVGLLGTNLECWYTHLCKKCQAETVLHKSTIRKLQVASKTCVVRTTSLINQLERLRELCDQAGDGTNTTVGALCVPRGNSRFPTRTVQTSWKRVASVAVSLLAASLTAAFVVRRLRV